MSNNLRRGVPNAPRVSQRSLRAATSYALQNGAQQAAVLRSHDLRVDMIEEQLQVIEDRRLVNRVKRAATWLGGMLDRVPVFLRFKDEPIVATPPVEGE